MPYNSRTNRKRRAVVNSTDTSNEVNPERLSMYRAIEVFLPKDEDNLPMGKMCFLLKLLTIFNFYFNILSGGKWIRRYAIPHADAPDGLFVSFHFLWRHPGTGHSSFNHHCSCGRLRSTTS